MSLRTFTREQLDLLRKTAPGAPLRMALDRIVQLGRGAILVLASRDEVAPVITAGFELDAPFTPEALAELCKMDRAVVVDPALRTILYANAHLAPEPDIPSQETGTRHRVGEQVAKQLDLPVIVVSEVRRRVTLYLGPWRYELSDLQTLMERVGQALSILERHRRDLRDMLRELSLMELERRVLPNQVAAVVHRFVAILGIEEEIRLLLVELGEMGELPAHHLALLMRGIDEEFALLLRDYQRDPAQAPEELVQVLRALSDEDLTRVEEVWRALGWADVDPDAPVPARGYRILAKIPRLPLSVIDRLVEEVGSIDRVARLSQRQLVRIKGIAETRARAIQYGLERVRHGFVFGTEGF